MPKYKRGQFRHLVGIQTVKYSMQYGNTGGETIIRYDNFPDHPGTTPHHKHLPNGETTNIEFSGLEALYDRFKQEVRDHGEHW